MSDHPKLVCKVSFWGSPSSKITMEVVNSPTKLLRQTDYDPFVENECGIDYIPSIAASSIKMFLF